MQAGPAEGTGVAVVALAVAAQRPAFGYSSGPVWTPRRTASVKATTLHRVSIPPQKNVDNQRPPMSRLTAKTLRKAHGMVRNIHRMGGTVPEGLALLERDYNSWRRRVQRGRQRETLLAVAGVRIEAKEDCPWHTTEMRQP